MEDWSLVQVDTGALVSSEMDSKYYFNHNSEAKLITVIFIPVV